MLKRLLTALVALPLFVAALLWLPNATWAALLAVLLLIGCLEWAALSGFGTRDLGLFTAVVLGTFIGLYVSSSGGAGAPAMLLYIAALMFWGIAAPLALRLGYRLSRTVAAAMTGWIVLVPAWLAVAQLQQRPAELLALLGVVWVADTCAYLAGKAFGRHKLAPSVSPGKTWEGVAGGLCGVLLYYGAISYSLPAGAILQGWQGAVFFLVLAALSVVGDLFESLVKRQAGVKDSGRLFPGHGGILDRVDGLTSTMPLAALVMYFMA